MTSLVLAGEAIFGLPFHVTRYFRPTFLEVFDCDNTQLGGAMAVYGVVAMCSYFPGGILADRFSARGLMVASLVTTALGGFYMATVPGIGGMVALWGFWGITSILLFWAALIRATRDWGGTDDQGKAYGILDGGRGLFGAIAALGATLLLQFVLPDDVDGASTAAKNEALVKVILAYTGATLGVAVLVWFGVPESNPAPSRSPVARFDWGGVRRVLRLRTIWLQSLVVIAAYIAYKGTDFYGLYAADVFGMDDVEAAQIATLSAWIRPGAALAAGLLADRMRSSHVVSACFVILIGTFGYVGVAEPRPQLVWLLTVEVIVACIAVYGLRGVYFALFEEASLPTAVTGTAVGVVSVLGYTPDIFVGPGAGWLLDTYPGAQGHQYLYLALAAASVVGLCASLAFTRSTRRVAS